MQNDEVKPYFEKLKKKNASLILKRCFDVVTALLMLIILSPVLLVLAVMIKIDSPGPVFYRQERVTQYGERFRIFKFRTMKHNAGGASVTVADDDRITRVGAKIRKLRLDEFPQLIDVLRGKMSFVGTRPEAVKYVEKYTDEMKATLLLPSGITCLASVIYKNEDELLRDEANVDKAYVEKVLPQKMKINLYSLNNFSLWGEIKTMFLTVAAVFGNSEKTAERYRNDILSQG